jgi:hypothetical protein
MPKAAEQHLKQEAAQKFPADEKRQNSYVYGALRHKLGWRPLRIKKKASKVE